MIIMYTNTLPPFPIIIPMQTLQPPKAPPNQARLIVTPESALEFGEVLGTGAFGIVYEVCVAGTSLNSV